MVAFPEDLLLEAFDQRAAKASTCFAQGERLQNYPKNHVEIENIYIILLLLKKVSDLYVYVYVYIYV